jgi:hypothetical protein
LGPAASRTQIAPAYKQILQPLAGVEAHVTDIEADTQSIKAIIERQFGALSWAAGYTGDWETFANDFVDGASLFPAARPLKSQTVESFITRMKSLAGKELRSLQERVSGTEIKVFGNIAVAVVECEMTENETTNSRTVEMLLLVKEAATWRIAAQAWDNA